MLHWSDSASTPCGIEARELLSTAEDGNELDAEVLQPQIHVMEQESETFVWNRDQFLAGVHALRSIGGHASRVNLRDMLLAAQQDLNDTSEAEATVAQRTESSSERLTLEVQETRHQSMLSVEVVANLNDNNCMMREELQRSRSQEVSGQQHEHHIMKSEHRRMSPATERLLAALALRRQFNLNDDNPTMRKELQRSCSQEAPGRKHEDHSIRAEHRRMSPAAEKPPAASEALFSCFSRWCQAAPRAEAKLEFVNKTAAASLQRALDVQRKKKAAAQRYIVAEDAEQKLRVATEKHEQLKSKLLLLHVLCQRSKDAVDKLEAEVEHATSFKQKAKSALEQGISQLDERRKHLVSVSMEKELAKEELVSAQQC